MVDVAGARTGTRVHGLQFEQIDFRALGARAIGCAKERVGSYRGA